MRRDNKWCDNRLICARNIFWYLKIFHLRTRKHRRFWSLRATLYLKRKKDFHSYIVQYDILTRSKLLLRNGQRHKPNTFSHYQIPCYRFCDFYHLIIFRKIKSHLLVERLLAFSRIPVTRFKYSLHFYGRHLVATPPPTHRFSFFLTIALFYALPASLCATQIVLFFRF